MKAYWIEINSIMFFFAVLKTLALQYAKAGLFNFPNVRLKHISFMTKTHYTISINTVDWSFLLKTHYTISIRV